jgi:hypothetical protein
LHFTHHVAQVFVHEKVKVWSAKLEIFSSPIVVEVSDDDDDDDNDSVDIYIDVDYDDDYDAVHAL